MAFGVTLNFLMQWFSPEDTQLAREKPRAMQTQTSLLPLNGCTQARTREQSSLWLNPHLVTLRRTQQEEEGGEQSTGPKENIQCDYGILQGLESTSQSTDTQHLFEWDAMRGTVKWPRENWNNKAQSFDKAIMITKPCMFKHVNGTIDAKRSQRREKPLLQWVVATWVPWSFLLLLTKGQGIHIL